jgi:hypothetical protein
VSGIEKIPLVIPEEWSAAWYRQHVAEVLSKLDTRNSIGNGILVSSDGNSVATLSATDAIEQAINAHKAETDPHEDIIDDLSAVSSVAESDLVLVSQSGENKKATVDQLAAAVFGEDWTDLRFPVQGINPIGAASDPVMVTSLSGLLSTLEFSGNQQNIIAGVAQMPHEWKRGSAIKPHIHWTKPTGSANAVTWEFYYRIVGNPGDVIEAWSAAQAGTIVAGDQTVSNGHLITSFPDITMTGFIESAIILWRLDRMGNTDAEANAVNLYELDFHYQSDKAGTEAAIPTE